MNKIFSLFFLIALNAFQIFAAEPAIWTVGSRAEILRGEANGVSITETGAITLSPRLFPVFSADQPYVWSSAIDRQGNVFLGTGGDGRVFRVDAKGSGRMFADLAELNVSALAIGADGALYAGTSPDGKVYRIDANGNSTVYFDPKERYIWSLAVFADGSLAVGTGENGKIFRVRAANASPETSLLFDTSETHIISMAADKQGNLFAGTDSSGLVLRFGADGRPFALLDSPLREIHDLTIGADGSVYALALSESASAAKPAAVTNASETMTITNENPAVTTEVPARSRYDVSAAKSVIYRILPAGGSDIIWNSSDITAFSILANPNGNGVFVGTSDKGRIYSATNDARETLLLQSNEGQISTLNFWGNQIFATSSNQGKLYRFGAETIAEGVYESPILNARTTASWGRIWWGSNGNVSIQTRSGNTERPDETWSAWSAAYTERSGAQVQSPNARFLQWRATLKNPATLNEVNIAYISRNIAPEILSIQILPTNVGLIPSPPMQIDPNIEASGMDPVVFGLPPMANIPPRRVFQRGARSLLWTADDRNGDRLEYSVYFREINETNFKLLRENLRENFFTIDGLAFADGRYVFRIVASDAPSNPLPLALTGEKISEPVAIDNTPPTVTLIGTPQISGNQARVSFEAVDTGSFLNRAEYSINGGEWLAVYADDGISDSPRERYTLQIPLPGTGEYAVTLRVFDVNGNAGSARAVIRR